jgi:hypothetical protein
MLMHLVEVDPEGNWTEEQERAELKAKFNLTEEQANDLKLYRVIK